MTAITTLLRASVLSLTALCIAAAPVAAQTTTPRAGARPARTPPRVALTGTVYDDRGIALDSATVRLARGTGGAVVTGANGRFALAQVPSQLVAIEVRRRGFHPLVLDVHVPTVGPTGVDVILFPLEERVETKADAIARAADSAAAVAAGRDSAAPDRGALERAGARAVGEPPARTRPRAGRGLVGIVTDTAGAPLLGAQISIVSQRLEAITDAQGTFAMPTVAPGAALVRVRRLGYLPRLIPLTVADDGATEVQVPLQRAGVDLGTVAVRAQGSRSAKLRGFEERKAAGFGQFRSEEQWKDRAPSRTADLLTDFNGVVVLANSIGKRVAYGRGRCQLSLFIDNARVPIDDRTSIDDVISVIDVAAVEVYTSISSIPVEFANRINGCGAIVLWTKTGVDR